MTNTAIQVDPVKLVPALTIRRTKAQLVKDLECVISFQRCSVQIVNSKHIPDLQNKRRFIAAQSYGYSCVPLRCEIGRLNNIRFITELSIPVEWNPQKGI